MSTQTFAEALNAAMERNGTNQSKLGRAAGASPAMLSAWLLGRVNQPDPHKVFAVEQALDLPPGQLSRHLGFMPVSREVDAARPVTFRDWLDQQGGHISLRQRTLLEGIYAEFVDATALAETEASRERRLADDIRRRDELAEENRRRRAAREPENH